MTKANEQHDKKISMEITPEDQQLRLFSHNKGSNPTKTYTEAKKDFDNLYQNVLHLPQSLVPVDGKIINNIPLRDAMGGGERRILQMAIYLCPH